MKFKVFKKSIFFILFTAFSFQSFAQLTLQERVNFAKGLPESRWSVDTVTPIEKIGNALQKIAGDLIEETLTPDSLFNYTKFHPTEQQMIIWCYRVLDKGGMINRMIPSIMSNNAWETGGSTVPDATIRTLCRRQVCAYASKP